MPVLRIARQGSYVCTAPKGSFAINDKATLRPLVLPPRPHEHHVDRPRRRRIRAARRSGCSSSSPRNGRRRWGSRIRVLVERRFEEWPDRGFICTGTSLGAGGPRTGLRRGAIRGLGGSQIAEAIEWSLIGTLEQEVRDGDARADGDRRTTRRVAADSLEPKSAENGPSSGRSPTRRSCRVTAARRKEKRHEAADAFTRRRAREQDRDRSEGGSRSSRS